RLCSNMTGICSRLRTNFDLAILLERAAPGPAEEGTGGNTGKCPRPLLLLPPLPEGHEQRRVSSPPQAKFGRGPPHQKILIVVLAQQYRTKPESFCRATVKMNCWRVPVPFITMSALRCGGIGLATARRAAGGAFASTMAIIFFVAVVRRTPCRIL